MLSGRSALQTANRYLITIPELVQIDATKELGCFDRIISSQFPFHISDEPCAVRLKSLTVIPTRKSGASHIHAVYSLSYTV